MNMNKNASMIRRQSVQKMRRSDSNRKISAVSPESPRAVVIIFGWSGADPQTLRIYEDLYHENSIATVSCTPPIINTVVKLSKLALDAAEEAVRVIRRSEQQGNVKSIPVLTHVFSHGGSLLLEQLEKGLLDAEISSANKSNGTHDPNPMDISEHNDLDNISLVESLPPSTSRRFSFRDNIPSTRASMKKVDTPVDTLQLKPRWWQIKRRQENRKSSVIKHIAVENLIEKNLMFLSKRLKLGAQIFDSAPCFHYNVTITALQAISDACSQIVAEKCEVFRGASQRRLEQGRRPSVSSVNTNQSSSSDVSSFSTISQALRWKRKSNWQHFEQSHASNRQLFIYSETDKYTHAGKLEELIIKKQDLGIKVYVLKLHDSRHVQHYIRYKQEYGIFVSSAIDSICGKEEENGYHPSHDNDNNRKNRLLFGASESFLADEDQLEFEEDSICDNSMIMKMQNMSKNYDD